MLGDEQSFQRLRRALDSVDGDAVRVANVLEAEARLADAVDVAVVDAEAIDADLTPRLRLRKPTAAVVAWLAVSSGRRTAELLAWGLDEVVHGGMGDAEVAARIAAAARRDRGGTTEVVERDRLRIDLAAGETSWDGNTVPLTPRERAVLAALAEADGRPLRREVLYRRVWGYSMARGDRTVDVNIKRLRSKLDRAASGAVAIHTQQGVGYRLEIEQADAAVTTL